MMCYHSGLIFAFYQVFEDFRPGQVKEGREYG